MRRLAAQTTCTALLMAVALAVSMSAGCSRKNGSTAPSTQSMNAVPVAESNWRNRLSLPPERIARNWVLADNTMLAELEYNSDGLGDTPQLYGYEVYDPKSDSARAIVPSSHSMIRRINDESVEFVRDSMGGLPFLEVYDIATRVVTTVYPAYPVNTARQFGVSNAWMKLTQVSVVDGGIDLAVYNAYQAPWLRVSSDESSRTLIIELPGISAETQIFGSLKTAGLAYVESAAVEPLDDATRPGAVIRIRTTTKNWDKLSYSMVPWSQGDTHVTVRLCQDTSPSDLSFSIKPPKSWNDWRENTMHRRFGISTSERLSDSTVLVGGFGYGVCDPETCAERHLVGDDSVLAAVTPDEVRFLCTGEGGGSVRTFPFFWVYDIATRSLAKHEVDLGVTAPVEVGGSGFTYGACSADGEGLKFSFKERPLMASGGGPPTTRTWADEASHTFSVEFPNAETDGLDFGSLDLAAAPFVVSASLSSGVRGTDNTTAPGVTVCLTLDAAKWPDLTYHIDTLADPNAPKPDWGYEILVLSFSDEKPATDISGIPKR